MKKINNEENIKKTVPLEDIPGPPDGGWGWVVCLASFFCNFTVDGIAYSFGILLVPLVDSFDSSRSTISWVGSLLCGIYMASGPIVGGLVRLKHSNVQGRHLPSNIGGARDILGVNGTLVLL